MEKITIDIAGVIICIGINFKENVCRFREFLSDGIPVEVVSISEVRLAKEYLYLKKNYPHRSFNLIDSEFNALFRELSSILYNHGVIIFHGVLISKDNNGYVFTGPSGIGKSTHANNWVRIFGDDVTIVSGDKIALVKSPLGLYGYGTPWKGKERIGNNGHVKINAICYIKRGVQNSISPIQSEHFIDWFVAQVMLPHKSHHILRLVNQYNNIKSGVNFYELTCNQNPSSAVTAYLGINT